VLHAVELYVSESVVERSATTTDNGNNNNNDNKDSVSDWTFSVATNVISSRHTQHYTRPLARLSGVLQLISSYAHCFVGFRLVFNFSAESVK